MDEINRFGVEKDEVAPQMDEKLNWPSGKIRIGNRFTRLIKRRNDEMKKNAASKFIAGVLVCACVIGVVAPNTMVTRAATKTKSTTTGEKTYLFAVPEGGWSSCTIKVKYSEKYVVGEKKNKFNSRTKSYSYKLAYATTKPKVRVGNICIRSSSGKTLVTFKKYKSEDVIYDPYQWDICRSYKSTKEKSYSVNTKNYGFLPYEVTCNNAIPGIHADSLTLKLGK